MTPMTRSLFPGRALIAVSAALTSLFATALASADYQANKYTEPGTNLVLEYNLYVPANVVAGTKYPLLVYLHAANNDPMPHRTLSSDGKGWVPQLMTADGGKTTAYYMIPISQTNASGWGDPVGPITDAEKFEGRLTVVVLKELLTKYPTIDPDRLYVTGASMGARGSWDMMRRYPDLFAAGAPCASPADPADAPIYVKQNIFSVNGSNDPVVQPNRDTIAAIRKACGNPIYMELAGHGHDSWRSIYPMPQFIAWMFAQRRGVPWVTPPPTPAQLMASEQPPVNGLTAGQEQVVAPTNCPGAWTGGVAGSGTGPGGGGAANNGGAANSSGGASTSGGAANGSGGAASSSGGATGTNAGASSSAGSPSTPVGNAGSSNVGPVAGGSSNVDPGTPAASGGSAPNAAAGSSSPTGEPTTVTDAPNTDASGTNQSSGCSVSTRAASPRLPAATLLMLLSCAALRRRRSERKSATTRTAG